MAVRRVGQVPGHKLITTNNFSVIRFPGRRPPLKGKGAAKCSCGLFSDEGLTDYSVRMWHRDHRKELLGIKE
jgi:hypothetical protein